MSLSVTLWLCTGVLLILSEFIVPGLVICFFGIAALLVAGILFFCPMLSLPWQLLICGITGVVLLFVCRKIFPAAFLGKQKDLDKDIDSDDVTGAECVCVEPVSGGTAGKVEFRGSLWTAESEDEIKAGDHCTVLTRNNLTLIIKKK